MVPHTSLPGARLTPAERRARLAEVLATGLVRLASALVPEAPAEPAPPGSAVPTHVPQKLPQSAANDVAVCPEPSVTVTAG